MRTLMAASTDASDGPLTVPSPGRVAVYSSPVLEIVVPLLWPSILKLKLPTGFPMLARELGVWIVTLSNAPDGEAVELGVERCAPEELVNCVRRVGVEGNGATALIDMVTSFSRDKPLGDSLSATAGVLFSGMCRKVVDRGNPA